MDIINAYIGEVLAFITAIVWAFAVILFRKSGEKVHPLGLNLFKSLLATVLFMPTIWIVGGTLLRPVPLSEYLLLLASGALGIAIADTLFFKSLNALGAGLSAIVDCMYSPFIIGLSILWLGETLNARQIIGAVMIVSAVLSAAHQKNANPVDRHPILMGIIWGVLAMATMAVGIVMIKPLLDRSPLLWVTEIRLFGGVIALMVILLLHPSRRAITRSIFSPQRWIYTWSGSFLGTYVAMGFWLAGMKFTQASIAAALNQTSNIFVFILAALLLRERITPLRIVGIVLGVAGSLLVTFG